MKQLLSELKTSDLNVDFLLYFQEQLKPWEIFVPPHLEREVSFRDSVSGGGVHIKVSAHLNKARTTPAHLS